MIRRLRSTIARLVQLVHRVLSGDGGEGRGTYAMKLNELLTKGLSARGSLPDVEVGGITADAQGVRPGDLFVSVEGFSREGRVLIQDAIERGAVAVVSENEPEIECGVPVLLAQDARRALAFLADHLWGGAVEAPPRDRRHRDERQDVDGAPDQGGARGLGRDARRRPRDGPARRRPPARRPRARGGGRRARPLPAARDARRRHARLRDRGVVARARAGVARLGAASTAPCSRASAGTTSTTTGRWPSTSTPRPTSSACSRQDAVAVLNHDDPAHEVLGLVHACAGAHVRPERRRRRPRRDRPARLARRRAVRAHAGRQRLDPDRAPRPPQPLEPARAPWQRASRAAPSLDPVLAALSEVEVLPGRMERVAAELPFPVFVDYAHNDAGARAARSRRCARSSRAGSSSCSAAEATATAASARAMARVAERGADVVVLTHDNPRSENPATILEEVLAGFRTPRPRPRRAGPPGGDPARARGGARGRRRPDRRQGAGDLAGGRRRRDRARRSRRRGRAREGAAHAHDAPSAQPRSQPVSGPSGPPTLDHVTIDGVTIDSRLGRAGRPLRRAAGIARRRADLHPRGARGRAPPRCSPRRTASTLDRVIAVERPDRRPSGSSRAMVRERFAGPVIAVGGSAGKTTTKEVLRGLLRLAASVVASEKSFNNHLGVPLTICGIETSTEVLVAEIGTNHPGEIAPLASPRQPDARDPHRDRGGAPRGVRDDRGRSARRSSTSSARCRRAAWRS